VPHADVNGQRLYYEVHGEGEPLLCVMGLAANSLAWALQVPAFSERYKTVVFDNRDVGQSSMAEGEYEIADMAADTLVLADHLGLETFHLLGVSMGGAIAQRIALDAPERIRTLTIAVSFASGGAYARKLSEVWSARVATMSREQKVDELMLLVHSEGFFENAGGVEFIRNVMLSDPNPQPADAFARQLSASSRHDARDELGTLSMPVHVIGAEHDILVPVWKSREIAELIPGSKFTQIDTSPHGVQVERAEDFNRAVLDFIAEHAPAPAGTA